MSSDDEGSKLMPNNKKLFWKSPNIWKLKAHVKILMGQRSNQKEN